MLAVTTTSKMLLIIWLPSVVMCEPRASRWSLSLSRTSTSATRFWQRNTWWSSASTAKLLLNMMVLRSSSAKGQSCRTQTDARLVASFQEKLDKPAWCELNQSGFLWTKKWWCGIGISWTIIFTGQKLFVTPYQQCQSTEGNRIQM